MNDSPSDSTALSASALLKLFPRRTKRGGIRATDQAAAIQRFAFDAAMALRESCTDQSKNKLVMDAKTAKALKDVVSAWETAAERLRILRGKGLPASVKPPKRTAPEPVQPLE